MKWICVLHFYQPPFQKPRILEQIVNECYLPLTKMLLESDIEFSLYFNINRSLIDQLAYNGHTQVLKNIAMLVKQKKVRLTLTPSFHPIIPLISEDVFIQQLQDNKEVVKEYFNIDKYDLFFPPELAYNPAIDLLDMPIVLSQSALDSDVYQPLVSFKSKKFVIRHNILSNMIMGGEVKSFDDFDLKTLSGGDLFVTAVDVETFGHHRKGYIEVLQRLLKQVETCWVSNQDECFINVQKLSASSWSSIDNRFPFILWKDPQNDIHNMLWSFVKLVEDNVNGKKERNLLHQSMSSCTFWWASANPWWSIEMVERGTWYMFLALKNSNKKLEQKAYQLYSEIVLLAFKWQREGVIDKNFNPTLTKSVPFSQRCKDGEFDEYLQKFSNAEKLAVQSQNYELAIRWRDAITKLKNNIDQYDNWHVVDQLRNSV